MIDPVIFEIPIPFLGITFALRWYGILVMLGALVGTWIAEKEITRRGGKGEVVWDVLAWVLVPGIIGARLWYVLNATVGGSNYYLESPLRILNIPEGGLHFFGGLVLGGLGLLYYLRKRGLDTWLFLDAVAPAALIGQAVARPANFINQELYGPPTTLPWGIRIEAAHRLPQYTNLGLYPVETAKFHPTFAYEMVWNFLAALLLIWISRRFSERVKPGAVFGGWLVLAGVGRTLIEFFRPDQPKIPGTVFSYSAVVSMLMAVAGVVLLLVRFGRLRLAAADSWEDKYRLTGFAAPGGSARETRAPRRRSTAASSAESPKKSQAGKSRRAAAPKRTKSA